MVFKYVGSSVFEVEIFDKSTSSIRYPCSGGHCVNAQVGKRPKWMKDCDCVSSNNKAGKDGDDDGNEQYDVENLIYFPGKDEESGGGGLIAFDRALKARRNGPKRKRTKVYDEATSTSPDCHAANDTHGTGDPENVWSCLSA